MTNRTWSILSVLALAVGGLPAGAAAQLPLGGMPSRHLIRIGVGGGLSIPTSDAADALDNGVNAQGFLLIDTGILPRLRLNLGYQKFDFKEAVLAGVSGETSILSGVAALSIDLVRTGPIRPYVTAGLGAFRLKDQLDAASGGGSVSSSSTKFGIDGGGGITLRLGRLEGFVEARIQNVYTDEGVIDTKTIRAIPVTFGLIF